MKKSVVTGVALLLTAAAAPAQAAPRMLVDPDGALTGPSGESRTAIARQFLDRRGFDAVDLGSPRIQQTPGGVTIVSYRPTVHGVPAFEDARVALDRAGRVIESVGSPPPAKLASTKPEL